MHVPPLTKINKSIIIAYVGLFILTSLLKASGINLYAYLSLSAAGLMSGYVFQIVTYPFIDVGLMTVVFNALIIWFIGSELEAKWGTHFYLKFLALTTYASGVVFAVAGFAMGDMMSIVPLSGLTGTNLALLIAYGLIYSERTMLFMLLFPMKAKYFCLLLAAIEMFMALSSSAFNGAWAHLISMGVAFVYLKKLSYQAQGLGLSDIMAQRRNAKAKQRRSNLRIVEQEEEKHNPKDPKYWQ